MLNFKEERNKQKITLTQIAERSGVDFREVYRFDIGAFLLMAAADMEKIVKALSTLYTSQRSFSVDGSTFGLDTVLGKLLLVLLDAGFVDTQAEAHLLDFSSYQDGTNRVVRQNMQVAFGQLAGFIRTYTGTRERHYTQLLAMAEAEMWQNRFCGRGTLYTFTAHARK